mmetsp:Transcript_45037/g.144979  ORF Transcript_45037/g.144979 Transcript_45037/m.144979 type:complete len:230 (+) Transcript_45037:902-1591(+)
MGRRADAAVLPRAPVCACGRAPAAGTRPQAERALPALPPRHLFGQRALLRRHGAPVRGDRRRRRRRAPLCAHRPSRRPRLLRLALHRLHVCRRGERAAPPLRCDQGRVHVCRRAVRPRLPRVHLWRRLPRVRAHAALRRARPLLPHGRGGRAALAGLSHRDVVLRGRVCVRVRACDWRVGCTAPERIVANTCVRREKGRLGCGSAHSAQSPRRGALRDREVTVPVPYPR